MITTMPFGKFKGQEIKTIETGYLNWLFDKADNMSPALKNVIEEELESRDDYRCPSCQEPFGYDDCADVGRDNLECFSCKVERTD